MNDQAENLRNLVKENIEEKNVDVVEVVEENINKADNKKAKIIAVTSGKGGVGKTNISVNLAIALRQQGSRVVIIDADLGLSNIEIIFGITPKYNLLDVIKGDKKLIEILEEGPEGVKFISGGSGIEEFVNIDNENLDKVIENIAVLDEIADFIIIDTGAGISKNVISFILGSDEVILVTTPEPTAITDAYGLLKILSTKSINKPINLLINEANSINEAQHLLNKFGLLIDKFLTISTRPMGFILFDKHLQKSVMLQSPVIIEYPNSGISKQIKQLSGQFSQVNNSNNGGIRNFIKVIKEYFTKKN